MPRPKKNRTVMLPESEAQRSNQMPNGLESQDELDESQADTGQSSTTPYTARGAKRTYRKRGPVPRSDQVEQIREELIKDFARFGMLLSFGLPLTGMVVVNRAERAANSLAALARQSPAVLRVLKLISGASIYGEVGFILGEVLIAVGVEQGAIPVDSLVAQSIRPEIEIAQKEAAQLVRVQDQAQQRQAAQTSPENAAGQE
jgi:hypothetical protein